MKNAMIVKVQLPLMGEPLMLVYNKDRSIIGQFEVDPQLKSMMKGRMKAYFYANPVLVHDQVQIIKPAPDQDW